MVGKEWVKTLGGKPGAIAVDILVVSSAVVSAIEGDDDARDNVVSAR